jgi:hypothetical protein
LPPDRHLAEPIFDNQHDDRCRPSCNDFTPGMSVRRGDTERDIWAGRDMSFVLLAQTWC